ncbi:MAG TPA: patatin-like phospholipase family protein [Spirochaetales bacterium]|nr:patatin-like phospholipase family protein [Spirochaetales bacterium]
MRWALVLSGGGSRGFAHIGLIEELERRGVPAPSLVAGTSMGAIIGALYASGWDAQRMEQYVLGFKLTSLLENPAFRLPDFALSRLLQAGTALGALSKGRSLDSGKQTDAEFRKLFGSDTLIENLKLPFACVAADLASGRQVIQDSGPLARAVRASSAYPAVFAPVERDGMLLVDGGILNNVPVDLAYARGIRRVLAMDVSPLKVQAPERMANGMSILMRCFDLASSAAEPKPLRGTLVLEHEDSRSVFNFDDPAKAIDVGRKTVALASDRLDAFFRPWPFNRVGRKESRRGSAQ